MKRLINIIQTGVLLLLLVSNISIAQQLTESAALRTSIVSTPCDGSTEMQSTDLQWLFTLTNQPITHPTTEQDQELIDRIKAEKLAMKQEYQRNHPNEIGGEPESMVVTPVKGTNFQGNANNGWTPLDNSVAISNGGYIVSVTNSTIQMFNTSGTSLYYNSLATFFNISGISSAFDPHVLYDRQSNRFIVVALSGTSSSTSRLIVCFSKTSNPVSGGWWKYNLDGDRLSNSKWFDYPKIAVTNGELFVTGNLFSNTNVFYQGIIVQINKTQGYSGSSMSSSTWYNISGTPASILPVGHGQGGSYGPACYFVSTSSSGSSTIKLYKISNIITASPTLTYNSVSSTSYSPAGDASQSGSSNLLDVGDCRALNGFYLSSVIHFVHNIDKGSGYCGIRYHRLNVSTKTDVSTKWSGSATSDYAYGAIASFATSTSDKSIMMGVQYVTSSIFPGIRVVNCDNSFNWSSSASIKSGAGYVNATSSSTERWGDYAGISRKHNSTTPSVWLSGGYGTTSHNWSTWISEVHASGAKSADQAPEVVDANTKIFPQPVMNTFNLEFNIDQEKELLISVYNESGSLVKELFNGKVVPGKNVLSFNKSNLSNGIYFLVGTDQLNTKIIEEKIIVTD